MPIKAVCSNCDKVYTLADEMAGKKLKCKECGEAFKVKTALVPKARKREDDDEDDRPRRKSKPVPQKKGGGMVWLLVGGGVAAFLLLILVGGGIAAYLLWPNKATPENFALVKTGMSEKEVVAIMGSPSDGISMNNAFTQFAGMKMPNMKELVWRGRNKWEFVVMLEDDRVVMKMGTDGRHVTMNSFDGDGSAWGGFQPPQGNPFGGGSSVNLGNFNRVRSGMTEGEVVGIMGSPSVSLPGQGNQKSLFWNGSNGDSVSVGLRDGRVFMGGGSINGQPVSLSGGR